MNMFQLQCFMAMVDNRVEQKAADYLNVSQPTLSKAISSLEAELNTKLFDRIGRGLALNENGASFYKYAYDATKTIAEGADLIMSLRNEMLGTITITSSVFSGVLSGCINAYCAKSPYVNFRFIKQGTLGIPSEPGNMSFNADLMLTRSIPGLSGEVSADEFPVKKRILEDEYLLIVSPRYIEFPENKRTIAMDEIRNCTFILTNSAFTANSLEFKLWNSLISRTGVQPARIIEVSDLVHQLSFLSIGIGVTFLSKSCMPFAKKYDASLRAFHVDGIDLKQHIMLARRRRAGLSAQAIDFWNHAMNYFELPFDTEE